MTMSPAEAARRQSIVDHAELQLAKLYAGSGAPQLSPPTKEPPGATDDKPHASREARICGNLFKGTVSGKINATYYSYNGWNYIGAKAKANRDVYNGKNPGKSYKLFKGYAFYHGDCAPNFNPEYKRSKINGTEVKKALEQLSGRDEISDASRELLKKLRGQVRRKRGNAGQALPYSWDAHHILPMEAFYTYLAQEHIAAIQRSSYDINTGQNMIFLPAQEKSMKYHHLAAHVDNHKKYTDGLKAKFNEIKSDFKNAKSKVKPHKRPECLANLLHDLEDEMFDAIVLLGPTRLP